MSDPPARDAAVTNLDERYGRSPRISRRNRLVGIVTAAAFALVFGAWLLWAGLLQSPAQLEVRDTGFLILDDRAISVRWEVSTNPGTEVMCAVQALNSSFGIVGWTILEIPPSDQRTRVLTDTLRTSELAVTGLIYRCWLT
ncbi:MAG: DUF4307 domain-containing protein [Salinibacterium sp.]|nr:DUF4307 domain-containing protein [Salinibacterium sp.]